MLKRIKLNYIRKFSNKLHNHKIINNMLIFEQIELVLVNISIDFSVKMRYNYIW